MRGVRQTALKKFNVLRVLSAHAAVADAFRERNNTAAAVWNGRDRIAECRSCGNGWLLRH
jgi:hypothetical protein